MKKTILLVVIVLGIMAIGVTATGCTGASVDESINPVTITGVVVSGGDTSQPNGPMDVPKTFVYKVRKSNGSFVNLSFTEYPPSPVGDAQRDKIKLEFYAGGINVGDGIEIRGILDRATATIIVENQGDYIRTFVR